MENEKKADVQINITRSAAGDLTVISITGPDALNENQIAYILRQLAEQIVTPVQQELPLETK